VLCIAASAAAGQGAKTYRDQKNRFSFTYPSDLVVMTGKAIASKGYFTANGKGDKLVMLSPKVIARKYHGAYEFAIWASNDAADKCREPGPDEFTVPDESDKTPRKRAIGGRTFYYYTDSDAGMSKVIEIVGYRAFIGKKCWQIQQGIYQAEAYEDYKPFDHKKIDREWNTFLKSIRFTR